MSPTFKLFKNPFKKGKKNSPIMKSSKLTVTSSFSVFPVEIFDKIVTNAVDSTPTSGVPLLLRNLSLVCKDWKECVEGNQLLWTALHLPNAFSDIEDEADVALCLQYAMTFLSRAGSHPSDLNLSLGYWDSKHPSSKVTRSKATGITAFPTTLRSLTLDARFIRGSLATTIPWSQLTVLHLKTGSRVHVIHQIFDECQTTLEDCEIHFTKEAGDSVFCHGRPVEMNVPVTLLTDVVCMKKLTHLLVLTDRNMDLQIQDWFKHLKLPSIKSVSAKRL